MCKLKKHACRSRKLVGVNTRQRRRAGRHNKSPGLGWLEAGQKLADNSSLGQTGVGLRHRLGGMRRRRTRLEATPALRGLGREERCVCVGGGVRARRGGGPRGLTRLRVAAARARVKLARQAQGAAAAAGRPAACGLTRQVGAQADVLDAEVQQHQQHGHGLLLKPAGAGAQPAGHVCTAGFESVAQCSGLVYKCKARRCAGQGTAGARIRPRQGKGFSLRHVCTARPGWTPSLVSALQAVGLGQRRGGAPADVQAERQLVDAAVERLGELAGDHQGAVRVVALRGQRAGAASGVQQDGARGED